MARSLTVKNEEKPGTSLLLNAFLVLAFGCLLLASFANATPAESAPPAPGSATVR